MAYKLKLGNIPLPELYVCRNSADAEKMRENGIPYIIWKGTQEELIKLVMLPTLKKLFPHIKWSKVLKIRQRKELVVHVPGSENDELVDTSRTIINKDGNKNVADVANSERLFSCRNTVIENDVELGAFVGDFEVNIEELQALKLLPEFMDDITTSIKKNLYGYNWYDGYNKKLKCCVGNFNSGNNLPNLIILDVSFSIPRGIADTMLALIDTLRSQANADLIVTGATSYYWKAGTQLPTPKELRKMVPQGQESYMFNDILDNHILGKKWGHVIAFGDNDTPRIRIDRDHSGTSVKEVWHYHTWDITAKCGYAKWVSDVDKNTIEHHNTKWCNMMDR